MKILLHWLILAAAVYATAYFIPGIAVTGVATALIVAACLAFINLTIKPIISLITLPINIVTLGIFGLLLNGAFFYFVAEIIGGFSIATFKAAILGALVVSIINWIASRFVD